MYDIDQLREAMVKILKDDGKTTSGSGFIIHSDGYCITCHHVISLLDAPIKAEYGGKLYEAEWQEEYSDPEVDIAVLKIDVKGARPVPIVNPHDLSTAVTVLGFPPSQERYFPAGFDVSAENIRKSSPINTAATYPSATPDCNHPWNKRPQSEATFLSHRIDAKVEPGTSGGPVFAKELDGVVGIIQCNRGGESYVIRWDNITEQRRWLNSGWNRSKMRSTDSWKVLKTTPISST